MLTRLRSRWLAGGSAMLLVLTLSGVVAAAALVSLVTAPSPAVDPPVAADTTATFEDADGDGIDDDCDQEVVPDATAAAAAEKAADLDGDGVISTSEAAQSDRVGGKNCNHGGYVSTVAHDQTDTCEADETETGDETEAGDEVTAEEAAVAPTPADACADATPAAEPVVETEDPAEDAETPAECVTAPAPVATPADAAPADTAPNAHGKEVSAVAQDKTAIGGKNCNHGGAVSEAAKKDQAAKDAKKNAAKEAAAAKHAAKGAKTHGKKNGD